MQISQLHLTLQKAWKKYRQTKKHASQLRQKHLEQRANFHAQCYNRNAQNEVQQLIFREKQRDIYKNINYQLKLKYRSALKHIIIPTQNGFHTIYDKTQM